MVIQLFDHPFSSYPWKAQIAFYENDTPFEFRMVDPVHAENSAEPARRSAVGKFPLLVEGGAAVFEATSIIEYLEAVDPRRVKLIHADPVAALKVRTIDRVVDTYVMNVMTVIVGDALRPEEPRDPYGVERAHANLDRIYAWLDGELGARDWACGADLTLADCASHCTNPKQKKSTAGWPIIGSKKVTQAAQGLVTIRNVHDQPIEITAFDQAPVSGDAELAVTITADPRPTASDVDDKPGVLGWSATYASKEERKIRFGWQITAPEGRPVTGLR